ncbi:MFS transporter [Amycolatopsis regifaucium]|uniref:MFS transporter n=1 Tax=Amycolatopsis regifaucium TaxID=546365 RepID=A0A154M6D4_9PSEU|nr:MFS transporter [Amycolatopsis regifaucium]KZB79927.1 multidrug transporter [Amycolatopsis regifaucium]OKA10066.1 MFS transporter [Amycolatopsis regifaucium]SFJ32944.1 Major Facilitator Superfamily protein [Amycolatopsis regifaucium]
MSIGQDVGSWRELRHHTSTAVVLAGGVLIGAITIYVAASLLPTAVQEIGGRPLYAWTMTAFLIAQVVATMLVGRSLSRYGGAGSYLIGFGVFAAGSVLCAVSPSMPVLLLGRGVQGFGAGLLTGLGFALIHSALPRRLWSRGSALISAMFGVGNFAGPALGGFSAQFGSWRMAFAVLAAAAVVLAVFVPRALPRGERTAQVAPVPVRSLTLVVAAAGAVGVAGILADRVAMAACLALGLALVAAFLVAENRATSSVLPRSVYRAGAKLRWIYLSIMVLASGVAVETFLPLFGQQLGGLPPAAAGFFAAALSLGWSVSQLVSASAHRAATIRRLLLAGPACLTAAFALLGLMQTEDPALLLVLAWLPVLLAGGLGIGIAMPHLSVAAMTSAPADEAGKAAGAIATVLTMSTAFGATIAGLLVNLGGPSVVMSARWLLFGFAAISAVGLFTARRAV